MRDTIMYATAKKGRRFSEKAPKVKVVGIGAGGSNVIGWMYHHKLPVELISINTDWQQLSSQPADRKLLIGMQETKGQGCGGDVVKGRNAAEESLHNIRHVLQDTELLFLIGGLGNGTATGGLPVIAEEAKKQGALVVSFLIIPFFMRKSDIEKTQAMLHKIQPTSDTTIVLDLNRLLEVYDTVPLTESFAAMNSLVGSSIASLLDLIREPEILEVNYSQIRDILKNGGFGTIGISECPKDGDVSRLVNMALGNRLFFFDPKNAHAGLVHVIGDDMLTLQKVNDAASPLKDYIDAHADIVVGAKVDSAMKENIRVVVALTGLDSQNVFAIQPEVKPRSFI